MVRIHFVPGAIASPAAITIPATAPDIAAVVSAEISRIPSALANHAAHSHTENTAAAYTQNATTVDAAAMAHAGASPVVAAVPTRITPRTFSLDVNTVLGDLLTLAYHEVGERVLVS